MNVWEILCIEPTQDIKAIRRAYAKQSKIYHPEEKPEEFKKLHNAYQQALKMAENKENSYLFISSEVVEVENSTVEKIQEEAEDKQNWHDEDIKENGLDFEKLFHEGIDLQRQKILESSAFKGIEERLRNPKQRNNKTVWKEIFFSDEYMELHIKPFFLLTLIDYLKNQDYIPNDNLPRIFCVWLSIIAGTLKFTQLSDYGKNIHFEQLSLEDEDYLVLLSEDRKEEIFNLIEFFEEQDNSEYNLREMKKFDYGLYRLCFMMFNEFLYKYPELSESEDENAWIDAAKKLTKMENNGSHRQAREDYCKIIAFIVRNMNVPNSAKMEIYQKFDMGNYEKSSGKRELKPLYDALTQDGKNDIAEIVAKQKLVSQFLLPLKNELTDICKIFLDGKGENELDEAIEKMAKVIDNPHYKDVWFSEKFLEWFDHVFCSSSYRWSGDCHWQLMGMIAEMYEQNTEKERVLKLLEGLAQRKEVDEESLKNKEDEKAFTYFGLPADLTESFEVLKEFDQIIQEKTKEFSYSDHVMLAVFAMARTAVVTNILSPISANLERFHLRHIREMPKYLIQWLTDQPMNKEDYAWWYIRESVNDLIRKELFDSEDVRKVTDRPEIVFTNFRSFLSTWYHFTTFEFKSESPAEAGMTSGFVLYPASMILRVEYDSEKTIELLNKELQRVQEDIDFLSRQRTYENLYERVIKYVQSDIFEKDGKMAIDDVLERIKKKMKEKKVKYYSPASKNYIEKFENNNGIKLPVELVRFYSEICNGCDMIDGFRLYGFSKIQYDADRIKNEFIFRDYWVWEDETDVDEEKMAKIRDGNLELIDIGCAQTWNIILTGAQAGEMWSFSDVGIQPCAPRQSFLSWFEFWLDGGKDYFSDF